jgi:phage terminase small subunit
MDTKRGGDVARIRDPARDKAKELYLNNKDITNREIANILGVDEKKIATWKIRDNWKCSTTEKKNVVQQNKKCSTTKPKEEKKELTSDEDKAFEYVDEEDGLTDRQRNFCYCYYENFNATQAAIKAGYSEKTAAEQGCRLLKNVKVKEFLEKLREVYRTEFLLTQERVMNRHVQIALSDMRDFITEDGKLRSNYDGTLVKKLTIRSSTYSDGEIAKEDRTVTLELEDRKPSLNLITKKLNLDPDTNIAKQRLEIEKEKVYGTGNGEGKTSGSIEKAKSILIKLRGSNESNR